MTELIRKLALEGDLEDREYIDLLEDENREAELFESALNIKKKILRRRYICTRSYRNKQVFAGTIVFTAV